MLRGIHKASSNWIGRAVMGVILGLITISFGIWGIGDIFRGFGANTVATVGSTEIRLDTFRQLYQDRLQQLGRQLNRPILPDQAKALGLDRQLLSELVAETASCPRRIDVEVMEPPRRHHDLPDDHADAAVAFVVDHDVDRVGRGCGLRKSRRRISSPSSSFGSCRLHGRRQG